MTVVADLLLLLGAALAVVAGVGAVRFSTAYSRIHAAGYIVVAALAMLVTLPIGAHLLFRAVHRTTANEHLRVDDLAPAERRNRPHRD